MKELIAQPLLLDTQAVDPDRYYSYKLISEDGTIVYTCSFQVLDAKYTIGGTGKYLISKWPSSAGYLVNGELVVSFSGNSAFDETMASPPTLRVKRELKGDIEIGAGTLGLGGITLRADGEFEGNYEWCGDGHSSYHL